jgi:hypothetical protein
VNIFKPGLSAAQGQPQENRASPTEGAIVLDWHEHYARKVMESLTGSGASAQNTDIGAKGRVVDLNSARKKGGHLEQ